MEPPRVLAIDDVRLIAPAEQAEAMTSFYAQVLGLDVLKPLAEGRGLAFRGLARAGPRVIVRFDEPREDRAVRRQLALEVRSLQEYAELFLDRGIEHEWARGWFYFERRLMLFDPAGNRVEMVATHGW